jgi:hypothetical protein
MLEAIRLLITAKPLLDCPWLQISYSEVMNLDLATFEYFYRAQRELLDQMRAASR